MPSGTKDLGTIQNAKVEQAQDMLRGVYYRSTIPIS